MGSRLRVNPTQLVECWCEVVAPHGKENPAWIIQKFPRTFQDAEVLRSIPQFTFPCAFEKNEESFIAVKKFRTAVQHFSFVLTNLESKFLYGFCRHAPDSETAIVVLSHLPWHELFYKILNHCSCLVSNKDSGDLWSFLQSVYKVSVPVPGMKLSVMYGDNQYFVSECPNHLSLPSIPENRNLSEYFSAVDIENMMLIFASMLNERRIIVTSERLARLSACVQAANALIYPMSWQHIFIPVLPEHLLDYLHAPMPFLIGVSWSLMKRVHPGEIGDVVILNADTNAIVSPYNDLLTIPEELVYTLRKSLSPSNNLLGDAVSRAFLKALVHLIGNYREALEFGDENRRISFNEEKFVLQRPNHFQPFVERMLQLQIFRQFIEERVELLNSGLHTSDEFELEASVFGDKSSSKVKQILSNVKKESGAIMKNVKKKTNPAMKSAMKTVTKGSKNVREKGKTTYREIRGKFREKPHGFQNPIATTNYINGETGHKPRSAPSSPTHIHRHSKNEYTAKVSYRRPSPDGSRSSLSSDQSHTRNSLSSSDAQKTPSPEEIDLIGELEDMFQTQFTTNFGDGKRRSTGSSSIDDSYSSTLLSNSSSSSSHLASTSGPISHNSEPFGSALIGTQDSTAGSKRLLYQSLMKSINLDLFAGSSSVYRGSLGLLQMSNAMSLDLSLNIPIPISLYTEGHSSTIPRQSLKPGSLIGESHYLPLKSSDKDSIEGPSVCCSHFLRGSSNIEEKTLIHKSPIRPKSYTLPGSNSQTVPTNGFSNDSFSPLTHVAKNQSLSHLPKYEASHAFSESLKRFSKKESNSSYFFSFLSRHSSKSSNSLFDFEPGSLSLTPDALITNPSELVSAFHPVHVLINETASSIESGRPLVCTKDTKPSDRQTISSRPPLLCTKYTRPSDRQTIMSSSLPPGVTSISDLPPLLYNCSTLPRPIIGPPSFDSVRKPKSLKNCESGSGPDLIFLESPKEEEEFDPLVIKDFPPPIPARPHRAFTADFKGTRNKLEVTLTNEEDGRDELKLGTPKRLSPTRYLPFTTLQNNSHLNTVQNPVYDQHQPLFGNVNQCRDIPANNSKCITSDILPPLIKGESSQSNNSVATFAASMLSPSNHSDREPSLSNHSDREPSQKITLPNDFSALQKGLSSKGNPLLSSNGVSSHLYMMNKGNPQMKGLSEKDLLGDYTSGFCNLSISSKDKNAC